MMTYLRAMSSQPSQTHGRSGRRPGESGTREAILAAARRNFSEHGYARSTLRAIAESTTGSVTMSATAVVPVFR